LIGCAQVKVRSQRRAWQLAVLMGAVLGSAPALVSAQVSLATVVDLAQRNSSAVKLAQADVNKAGAQLAETRDVVIPSLLFGTGLPVFPEVGFTGTPPSLWTATIQSVVFSLPQKRYINAARLGLLAAASRLKDAREETALEASTAYIELDTVNRELEAIHQQEEFASRLISIVQQRTEAGVDPMSDLLQTKLTAAELKLKGQHLEARAGTLSEELATLTGMPVGAISTDHATIPEIPVIHGDKPQVTLAGINSANFLARSKQQMAKGDEETSYLPELNFALQYNRNTNILNNVNQYFAHSLPANNFSSGISIQLPVLDFVHRAKARESNADALRSRVEAEQAERQNDVQIVELTGTLRELDTVAEIASLKQQIAGEQLKTVQTELQVGNGAGSSPGGPAQLTPKAEELARIDERQKYAEALDAGFDLAKARLGLLRALGHMEDWLHELHSK